MRIGSLFSGYGGLDMAVESVFPDARPAWFCEWDDAPSKVLAHHWPDVPNYRDVSSVDWDAVKPVDILTGGFPCQDVSHAGRRNGLIRDGEGRTRSGLWGQMLRAIDTIRPPLVVAENVRGLLSATADSDVEPCPWCVGDGGAGSMRALGAVLADLADIGFDAAWCGLRAADVGAAHGRFRVFILAWPTAGDASSPTWRASQPERVGTATRSAAEPREPVGATAETVALLPTPAVNDMGASYTPDEWDAWTDRMKAAHGNGNGHGKSLSIEAQRLLPTPRATDGTKGGPNQRGSSGDLMLPSAVHLLPTPQARDYKDHQVQVAGHRPDDKDSINRAIAHLLPTPAVADVQGGRKHRSGARSDELLLNGIAHHNSWGDYAPAIERWESAIGRPAPEPTEPGAKGNPRLSPRFVEWLMGLPAGHLTDPAIGLSRNQQLKALGNGVVPQQGAAALEWLLSVEAVTA